MNLYLFYSPHKDIDKRIFTLNDDDEARLMAADYKADCYRLTDKGFKCISEEYSIFLNIEYERKNFNFV